MKTNFSGPEFIAIVSTLFVVLTALSGVARLQRSIRQSRKLKPTFSSPEEIQLTTNRTPKVRVITEKRQEVKEELEEAS